MADDQQNHEEPADRTPGWKIVSEGLERWWAGSQWTETYQSTKGESK